MFMPTSPFSVGANLPWIRYGNDFGANAWHPRGGLASAGVPAEVRARAGALTARGVSGLRWFLFCDGRSGIHFDQDGTPLGLDAFVLEDLDAAVAFAEDLGVPVMFTLFDFLWCLPAAAHDGVTMQGRRGVWRDPRQRSALLERVVRPVVDRYGHHRAVCGWDIVNEPEWVTRGQGTWKPWASLPRDTMRTFIAESAALIHRVARQPVTVGLASGRGLPLVDGCGLDFYQVHWYDKLEARAPLATPVAAWQLDKPILLGEYPTRGSRREPASIVHLARANGYAGAWLWSICASDASSDVHAALASLESAPEQHAAAGASRMGAAS